MELKDVRNIGPKTLDYLNANGIYTMKDLLLYFPKKYNLYQVDNDKAFTGELLCFKCQIASRPILIKTKGKSRAFVFYAVVNQVKSKCVIFSAEYLRYKLQQGLWIIAYGKYKEKDKEFILSNIFFEDFQYRIQVDYGIKEVQNKLLQNAISQCFKENSFPSDTLPSQYVTKYRLLSMEELIKKAHFPVIIEDCIQVRRRVRYEDFFWYTASLEALKLLRGFEHKNPKLFSDELIFQMIDDLPYVLTNDQMSAVKDILADLKSTEPMNRLIEGDVGCGKSIVSFLAAIATMEAGYQVAVMAPTEILAIQHFNSFKRQFPQYEIALLTSSVKQKNREDILYRLVHHRIHILVGTHSLLQESVVFAKLGLVIIDEQHRFGVQQRKTLIDKIKNVDALYLTATPIPRTLGLTTFGDLKLSRIEQMPKNRKPVITKLITYEEIQVMSNILNEHINKGEQIYIVVPLIEESASLDFIDLNKASDLFSLLMPSARIAVLHGRMKSKEKDLLMSEFKMQHYDCLISTTVIEVGVDVKNASIMVILDAERYGLSQLHQLRGRVGRGDQQSYCYLVSKKEGIPRLSLLEKLNNGFDLAEEDLKLRGPGDYLGEEQSGFNSLNIDFASKDMIIWQCAMADSKEFVSKYLNNEVNNDKMAHIIEQTCLKKTKIN